MQGEDQGWFVELGIVGGRPCSAVSWHTSKIFWLNIACHRRRYRCHHSPGMRLVQGDKDEVLEQNSSTSKFDLSLVTDRLLKVCFVAAKQEKGNKGGG